MLITLKRKAEIERLWWHKGGKGGDWTGKKKKIPRAEFMFSKTWLWATQKTEGVPGSSLFPTGSVGVISAVTSAGFPPANTANCVWRSTCCHRLKPRSPWRPAGAFSPVKEDFWTLVLQPFQCAVSSCWRVNSSNQDSRPWLCLKPCTFSAFKQINWLILKVSTGFYLVFYPPLKQQWQQTVEPNEQKCIQKSYLVQFSGRVQLAPPL